MAHTNYSTTTRLPYADGDNVTFGGNDDTISFIRGGGDTVTTTGMGQTVVFDISANDKIIDHGWGLNIEIEQSVGAVTIKDFDPAGKITLGLPTEIATVASDGHGGTMLTATGYGAPASLDFVDRHVTMSQVTYSS